MMTVLIDCGADAPGLAISLASLVPGAVDGLVRDVVVIDRGMDAAARKVADHAGCRLVAAEELRAVVAGAKGDWLMFVEPGARLGVGWVDGVAEHLAAVETGKTPAPARFRPARPERLRFLQRLRRRTSALADGLVLPKAQGIGLAARHGTLEGMARGLATAELAATIRPRGASA